MSDFKAKMYPNSISAGVLSQTQLGRYTSSHRPTGWIKGPTSKRRGEVKEMGNGKGRKGYVEILPIPDS